MGEKPDFRHLPEPIRLEDTISTQDTVVPQDEGDEAQREIGWMLRTTGVL